MSKPTQTEQDSTKKFSPFAGCSIFIIAGVLAAGMIGFTIWTYFKVKDTIAGFTGETPQAIELVDTTGKETAQTDLKAKLVGFRHNIEAKHKARMSLDAEEMNLAIATFDILKPHRNNLTITSISDGKMEADIAFPVKSSMGSEEMRYLNATITIVPELVEGAAFPRITAVRPNTGGDLPEQFKQFISETLLHPFREDKELGPVFNRLSAVEIVGNTLVLHTDPDYHLPSQPNEENKQSMFERFMTGFAVIAVIFLAIVAFIIILSRRKAKQS
ncbi:MAG: hypothetical protein H7A51_13050 [Akkermansiaceae bacterium]|nr:hypothetical protein [Akkermansiaceae bacterium]